MLSVFMRIVAKLLYLGAMALVVYFAIVVVDDFGLYNTVEYDVTFMSIIMGRVTEYILPACALVLVGALLDWKS